MNKKERWKKPQQRVKALTGRERKPVGLGLTSSSFCITLECAYYGIVVYHRVTNVCYSLATQPSGSNKSSYEPWRSTTETKAMVGG